MARKNISETEKNRSEESEDMYLKAIYVVRMRKYTVRSVDICDELDFARSSVSRGVSLLKEKGYITVDSGNVIYLTASGLKKAKNIYERYIAFTEILTSYGVPEDLAKETACKMEHAVSDEVFEYIKKGRRN